jgi:hypothetical protein
VSIFDKLEFVEIEPGYDPCRICGGNAISGAVFCDCEYDERGNITRDCDQCSNDLICSNCDDRFTGFAVSIGVFY